MLSTSARLLRLLSHLQAKRFWRGGELVDALGVTSRSVRRDVLRLRELGYPVHATSGVGGGYQLGAGRDLPPLPLDDEEAIAVAVGLRAATTGPVRGLEAASLRALTRLEQVLPKRLRKRVNALQSVSVRYGDSHASIDAETLSSLASACRDEVTVRFEYKSHEGAASVRSVEPYRLVHSSYRWYLLAWDLEKGAWRTFRVDRVGAKLRAGKSFAPRALPASDVAAYVRDAVGGQLRRYRARVTVFAPASEVRAKLSWMNGRVEEVSERACTVHLEGDSIEGAAAWLVVLGREFTVHEPDELRAHLREVAGRLARAAGYAP